MLISVILKEQFKPKWKKTMIKEGNMFKTSHFYCTS